MPFAEWIKRNKLAAFLLLVIGIYFLKNLLTSFTGADIKTFRVPEPAGYSEIGGAPAAEKFSSPNLGLSKSIVPPIYRETPPTESKERMVAQESFLSLVVKNVSQAIIQIKRYTEQVDGYMVDSNLSNPQEAASGSIIVRIPQDKLDETLAYFRSQAIKIVSENIKGTDVTDEYVDLDARLMPLLTNKKRFEEIMDKAEEVADILRVQQEIINLQNQIDQITGQKKYLEQISKLAKITVYLSTDEFSLPYAPSQPFRPEVVFKTAVRSLIGNLRKIASLAIWLAVYSVIWGPILVVFLILKRRKRQVPGSTA